MPTKKLPQCRMPGCEREAGAASGVCNRCYAFLHYWKGRPPGDLLDRAEQIHFWEQRINAVIPKKVSRIKRRRSAA